MTHKTKVNITIKGLEILSSVLNKDEIINEIMKHEKWELDGKTHEQALALGSETFKNFIASLPILLKQRYKTIGHDIYKLNAIRTAA